MMAPPVPSGASQRLPQHQPQVAAPACSNTRPPWVPERLPDCVPGPRRDHTSIGVRPAADTIDPAAQSTRNKDCSIDPGCNIKEFDAPGPSGAMCSTLDRQVPLLLSGPGPAPVPDMSGMNGYWNAPFNFNMGVSMFHNTELDVKVRANISVLLICYLHLWCLAPSLVWSSESDLFSSSYPDPRLPLPALSLCGLSPKRISRYGWYESALLCHLEYLPLTPSAPLSSGTTRVFHCTLAPSCAFTAITVAPRMITVTLSLSFSFSYVSCSLAVALFPIQVSLICTSPT